MLELDGLLLRQGAFDLRADWRVAAGGRVALIGPSGGGKSTLLAAVAGFLAPVAGRVRWDGRDLGGVAPGERPVSVLFQDQNLFPHLTLSQNVAMGLRPDLRLSADQTARVAAALERVGLGGMAARRPGEVSGGQQARAALARVLLRARPVLLLDEPFAALGPGLKADMLALVGEVADETGALVLLVSHDPGDALRFGGLLSVVAGGVAAEPRPVEQVLADPPAALADYLGPGWVPRWDRKPVQ